MRMAVAGGTGPVGHHVGVAFEDWLAGDDAAALAV
jgi:hypothetical protein